MDLIVGQQTSRYFLRKATYNLKFGVYIFPLSILVGFYPSGSRAGSRRVSSYMERHPNTSIVGHIARLTVNAIQFLCDLPWPFCDFFLSSYLPPFAFKSPSSVGCQSQDYFQMCANHIQPFIDGSSYHH